MKRLMIEEEEIKLAAAFITTPGEGGEGGYGSGEGGQGEGGEGAGGSAGEGDGASGKVDGSGEDLATLFAPEEIEAKKTAIAEAKAEEERVEALTDEEREAEKTAAAEAAKRNEVPETYEFDIPEGYTVDEELMTEVQQFAKDNNMTQAEAQKIADMGAKLLTKQQELRETSFNDIKEGWLKSAQEDPEIGADVLKGKDSVAGRAFNTIATPEMKEMVDQYGIGNHPEMLRMFYRLSSLMGEDKMHMPGHGAGSPDSGGIKGTVGGIFNHPSRKTGNE